MSLGVSPHPAPGATTGASGLLQLSIPTLDPQALMDLGRDLAPLRDQGVLIIGSGFLTHNLRVIGRVDGPGDDRPGTAELAEFDDWGREALDAGEIDRLVDFRSKAPAAHVAHPRADHWVPLYVVLGAAEDDLAARRQRTRHRRVLVRQRQALHPARLSSPPLRPGYSGYQRLSAF